MVVVAGFQLISVQELLELKEELEQVKRKVVYGEICRKENEKLLLINVDLAAELCRTRRRAEGLEGSALEAERDALLAELQKERDRSQAETEFMTAERDSLFEEKQALERKVVTLRANECKPKAQPAEKQSSSKEVASLKANESRLKTQSDGLKADKALLLAEKQSLVKEVASLKANEGRLNTQLNSLSKEVVSLKTQIDGLKTNALYEEKQLLASEVASLKANEGRLNTQVEALRRENRTARLERKAFATQCDVVLKDKLDWGAVRDSVVAAKDLLERQRNSLMEDQSTLREDKEQLEAEVTQLLASKASLVEERHVLEQQLMQLVEERDALLTNTAKERDLLQANQASIIAELDSLLKREASVVRERDMLVVVKSRLEEDRTLFEAVNYALVVAKAECEGEVVRLCKDVDKLAYDNSRLQHYVAQLTNERRELQTAFASANHERSNLDGMVNNMLRVVRSLGV